ncbi:MAG: PpiC-type peptidyl-prolyl cis-trans isomerase [uncultured bacterium]|nr:MAG: PpiC-type peptidyl-prolyl cis-trans isomerase [uncultured bacterium]
MVFLLWPVGVALAGLVLDGCSSDEEIVPFEPTDKPLPFPNDPEGDITTHVPETKSADTYDGGADTIDASPACTPDPCNGVRIDDPKNPEQSVCVSFSLNPVTLKNKNAAHLGFNIVDINNDGQKDIYLLNDGAPNELLVNKSNFQDQAKSFNLNLVGPHKVSLFSDYDQDGDNDLLLAGDNGSDLFANQDGVFNPMLPSSGIHNPEPATAAVWLGSNLLLGTQNGTFYYRHIAGDQYVEATKAAGLYDTGTAASFAVGDFNGDGLDDVYLANNTGANRLFQNMGNDQYQSVENQAGVTGTGISQDAQWVRFQGEALPSLFVASWETSNQLFVNNQNGTFTNKALDLGVQAPGQNVKSLWMDLLNDQRPWLFLARFEQENLLYSPQLDNQKNVVNFNDRAYPLGLSQVSSVIAAQTADFNEDGYPDLITVMSDGPVNIYTGKATPVKNCVEAKP